MTWNLATHPIEMTVSLPKGGHIGQLGFRVVEEVGRMGGGVGGGFPRLPSPASNQAIWARAHWAGGCIPPLLWAFAGTNISGLAA